MLVQVARVLDEWERVLLGVLLSVLPEPQAAEEEDRVLAVLGCPSIVWFTVCVFGAVSASLVRTSLDFWPDVSWRQGQCLPGPPSNSPALVAMEIMGHLIIDQLRSSVPMKFWSRRAEMQL